MKKENLHKLLYLVSVFLLICFIITIILDYINYDYINNSAPFYAFIIIRFMEFILPSIAIFIIAKIVKRKYSK